MFGFDYNVRYFVCATPVDMRNSFDGLAGVVRNFMQKTPTSGAVFIFFNKNRTHVKLLFWDTDGFTLYYKRLEQGRFQACTATCDTSIEVDKITLNMLLEGVKIDQMRRLKRYKIQ